MKSLDPTGVTEATMTFDTPEGATTMQAYSWCNIHGLYEGPVTEVEAPAAEVDITEEATDTDAVTVKEAPPSSGTAAVVSLSVIASAITLTALEM
eukprot:scaffold9306_cov77-Skeletonema_dohrnii-CCMP3373.AAC.1